MNNFSEVKKMKGALHFVGFSQNDNFRNAAKVFGKPDFIHRVWDHRAKAEVVPGDVAVFAVGNDSDKPRLHAYDDSALF